MVDADKEILIDYEERLDRRNISVLILDDKVSVIKSLQDRILDDLVVTMILSFVLKGTGPASAVR